MLDGFEFTCTSHQSPNATSGSLAVGLRSMQALVEEGRMPREGENADASQRGILVEAGLPAMSHCEDQHGLTSCDLQTWWFAAGSDEHLS